MTNILKKICNFVLQDFKKQKIFRNMDSLSKITAPIGDEMVSFEAMLLRTVANDYPVMGEIVDKLVNLKGKRMRPILTLLVAKMLGGIDDKHMAGAVIMEITHNASLIHDDVIDEASLRRGELTLNAHLRSKGAVLAGDFLLACGIDVGVKSGNYRAVEIAARTLKQLVEGELQQAQNALLLTTTIEDYFRIIDLKTAYLLAASAEVGASGEHIEKMYRFGELIGQAYQIKDDILDYVGKGSGKELFNDIKEHKITLPLLCAFEECGRSEAVLEDLSRANSDNEALRRVADFVINSDAIEMCNREIDSRRGEAMQILAQYPNNEARRALETYCDFVTKRNY